MGVSPAYGQTPNIWPLSSLDIDTALRKERRPPKPPVPSTLLMGKDQFAKGGDLRFNNFELTRTLDLRVSKYNLNKDGHEQGKIR